MSATSHLNCVNTIDTMIEQRLSSTLDGRTEMGAGNVGDSEKTRRLRSIEFATCGIRPSRYPARWNAACTVQWLNHLEVRNMDHQKFESCIEACDDCAAACDHCATACLKEPKVEAMSRCILLDRDCASICRLASQFMAAGSPFAARLCALCAEVCEACAAECEKHEAGHCRDCAKACRECANQCRQMAG